MHVRSLERPFERRNERPVHIDPPVSNERHGRETSAPFPRRLVRGDPIVREDVTEHRPGRHFSSPAERSGSVALTAFRR
jgi:hypothetical protein